MAEIWGILAAILSSAIGGTAVVATRYVVGATDPITLGFLRFGIGLLLLTPIALALRGPWPDKRAWLGIGGLGVLFFALFPLLFNAALIYTTAARGALALSTLPLLTMLAAALLHIEPLTPRKSVGVVVAMTGVAIALLADITQDVDGAWRGDLLMIAAALSMALYNVWSRSYIQRFGPIRFTAFAMAAGALCLLCISWISGTLDAVDTFDTGQWIAIVYLGVFCGALVFFLWGFALGRTTPTRVAVSVTVNPITAAIFGAITLDEPIRVSLMLGLVAVFIGIWLAVTNQKRS